MRRIARTQGGREKSGEVSEADVGRKEWMYDLELFDVARRKKTRRKREGFKTLLWSQEVMLKQC